MTLRDFSLLSLGIPLAEKLSRTQEKPSFFRSTMAFVASGIAASFLSYPFQYIGLMQKNSSTPVSMRAVFAKTFHEQGLLGVYRGFGMATGRIALYNLLFGAAFSLGERIVRNH